MTALHFSIADFSCEMGWEAKAQVVETKEWGYQKLFSYCTCFTPVTFSTIVTLPQAQGAYHLHLDVYSTAVCSLKG